MWLQVTRLVQSKLTLSMTPNTLYALSSSDGLCWPPLLEEGQQCAPKALDKEKKRNSERINGDMLSFKHDHIHEVLQLLATRDPSNTWRKEEEKKRWCMIIRYMSCTVGGNYNLLPLILMISLHYKDWFKTNCTAGFIKDYIRLREV